MSGLLIGYARVSTEEQDLIAQRNGLAELDVDVERVHVDHGYSTAELDDLFGQWCFRLSSSFQMPALGMSSRSVIASRQAGVVTGSPQ